MSNNIIVLGGEEYSMFEPVAIVYQDSFAVLHRVNNRDDCVSDQRNYFEFVPLKTAMMMDSNAGGGVEKYYCSNCFGEDIDKPVHKP